MKVVINKNVYTVCDAPQKCEDCKAYVTRFHDNYTESGHDVDVWEECAFGYIKRKNYDKYLDYINNVVISQQE